MPATPAWPPKSLPRLFVRQPLAQGSSVELDPGQAETLINAATLGQLTLTLRAVVDFNNTTVAGTPNSNQTVRLIRFGKEQAVLAGSNPTLVGQQTVPMTPDLYPQTDASGGAAEPTVSIEPQAVPE